MEWQGEVKVFYLLSFMSKFIQSLARYHIFILIGNIARSVETYGREESVAVTIRSQMFHEESLQFL